MEDKDLQNNDHSKVRNMTLATAALVLVLVCGNALGQEEPLVPFHTDELLPGVMADLYSDGALEINISALKIRLLTGRYISPRPGRNFFPKKFSVSGSRSSFTAVVAAGFRGGQRGFSAERDDDRDGAINEDRLDGLDNDGDGLVDEDFAAIGDAMAVWDRPLSENPRRSVHGEYYHWTYPRLRSVVFLNIQENEGLQGRYALRLRGKNWQETTAVNSWHDLAGQPRYGRVNAFVAPLESSVYGADPESRLWLGLVVLTDTAAPSVVLKGSELSFKLSETPLSVAICVAESWLQLSRQLSEAARLRLGVTDQLTGRQAAWIVPSPCALCQSAAAPRFVWTREQDLVLTAVISAEWGTPLDPDLFRVNGRFLGPPSEIFWIPDQGESAVVVSWRAVAARPLKNLPPDMADPFAHMSGLRNHRISGKLQYVFDRRTLPDLRDGDTLQGVALNGRKFAVTTEIALPKSTLAPTNSDADRALPRTNRRRRLALSSDLLEGFPNPFRETIALRFVVPSTAGEAFVWDENSPMPRGLEKSSPVPWVSGEPRVSIKIYSINGQELVTLFSGNQGPGSETVHWSGTDSFGRQVASGTYFCKLQMDRWSVTRRLVFLR